jgi:hypothetical protein
MHSSRNLWHFSRSRISVTVGFKAKNLPHSGRGVAVAVYVSLLYLRIFHRTRTGVDVVVADGCEKQAAGVSIHQDCCRARLK